MQRTQHLTAKQRAFAKALVSNGGRRAAAARQVGYSQRCARSQAYELLQLSHVVEEVIYQAILRGRKERVLPLHFLGALLDGKSERIALLLCRLMLEKSASQTITKTEPL